MKKIAITGGIGSGKTHISNMFFKLGIPIFTSDDCAKKIINSNIEVKNNLINDLGKDCYRFNKLNKEYVSNLIFNDKSKLQLINSIVHPFVKKDYENWLLHQIGPYTLYESAIIFENNDEYNFDKVIGIVSDVKLRHSRLLSRGMSSSLIQNIMNNQITDDLIVNLSDFIIYNNINVDLIKDINKIHLKILNH
tara:strand:- start:1095 stop:1673 length:579 start_codon:yes stop_codon:yes gene_type:complete